MAEIRIANVSDTLWLALKLKAISSGKTIRQFILDLISEAVKGASK